MASIYISELISLSAITNDDFIPVVNSASLSTYRVSFNTISTWISESVTSARSLISVSSSYANYAISSSQTNTSSFLIYNGYDNGTASYAISSSYAETASYFNVVGLVIDSASYALQADYAGTSSYSLHTVSSSYAATASFSESASYALTSSYSISGSYSVTASFAVNFPPTLATPTPAILKNLLIVPNNYYFQPGAPAIINITSSEVIVYNVSGDAFSLPDCALTCDKDIIGNAGGRQAGTLTSNRWYDLWIIYNSSTLQSASFMSVAGSQPGHSKPVASATVIAPPSGWDYKTLAGSVYYTTTDVNIMWEQWFEFGERHRSNWSGLASSITTTPLTWLHWLGYYPSDYFLRFRKWDNISSDNYPIGAEIPYNVVYFENSQTEGYEDFVFCSIKHTTTNTYVVKNNGGSNNWLLFNTDGTRGHDWGTSTPKWLAYYTAIQ